MSEQLLPCPFCGGQAQLIEHSRQDPLGRPRVDCSVCRGGFDYVYDKETLVRFWNTRHSPWISVKDRLPQINEWEPGSITGKSIPVLVYKENFVNNTPVDHRPFDVGVLRKGGRGDLTSLYWDAEFTPTHWMPLPEAPEAR